MSVGVELRDDLVELVLAGERGDPLSTEHGLQRARNVGDGDPQVFCPIPLVDDRQFGLVDLQVLVHVHHPFHAARTRDESVQAHHQGIEVGVPDHEVDRAASKAPQRGWLAREGKLRFETTKNKMKVALAETEFAQRSRKTARLEIPDAVTA